MALEKNSKIQVIGTGGVLWAFTACSGAGPQPKSNFVH